MAVQQMVQYHKKVWGAFLPRVCNGLVVGSLSKDAEEVGSRTLSSWSTSSASQPMPVLKAQGHRYLPVLGEELRAGHLH